MVGTLGQPPRGGDLGPGRLVVLGLVVSLVSFAGFRVTTDTRPGQPVAAAPVQVVSASIPNPIPNILVPSALSVPAALAPSDPVLGQSTVDGAMIKVLTNRKIK